MAEVRTELSTLATELSTEGLATSAWQEYGGLLVNLRNIVDAAVELARWSSEAASTPRRSKRYDVPRTMLRPVRRPENKP